MTEYSEAFRNRMVMKLSGPQAVSAKSLAREVGVSQPTLSKWLRQAGKATMVSRKTTKSSPQAVRGTTKRPSDLSAEEKFRVVMEAASLSETALGAFLRREGLHDDDIVRLREDVRVALASIPSARKARGAATEEKARIKTLERELKRSQAALAETAALLVLRKKAGALWGEEGDDI